MYDTITITILDIIGKVFFIFVKICCNLFNSSTVLERMTETYKIRFETKTISTANTRPAEDPYLKNKNFVGAGNRKQAEYSDIQKI